jgi:hypothetical protein
MPHHRTCQISFAIAAAAAAVLCALNAVAATCPVPVATCSAADPLCVVPQSPTTAIVSWQPVAGAVDYLLIRNNAQLIRAEESQSMFRSIDMTPGAAYNYQLAALDANGATIKTLSFATTQPAGSTDLTAADAAPASATLSRAMTSFGWTPLPPYDTCSKALHDAFWAYGPDNKVYPTWHPPVYEFADGSMCTFGHEHGQDQRQSNLYATTGPIPFAYVNEQLSPTDPAFQRNEDHVGHKVAAFNGLLAYEQNANVDITCDVLFKLHQGGHSPDALKNNSHERFLNYRCSNGFEARWKSLQPFGSPNSFKDEVANLYSTDIATAGASAGQPGYGSERRTEPTERSQRGNIDIRGGATEDNNGPLFGTTQLYCDTCQPAEGLAAYVPTWNNSVWQGGPAEALKDYSKPGAPNVIGFGGGPYWYIKNAARYYDPAGNPDPTSPNYVMSRQINQCYNTASPGYNSRDCQVARKRNGGQPIAWNNPLSPFKATVRFNEFNFVDMLNTSSSTSRLYATPFGYLAADNNGNRSYDLALIQKTRSAKYPIRQFLGVTPASGMHITAANWAGTGQCGGKGGNGACFTDFNFYKNKIGQLIDAAIHAPN